MPFDFLFVTLQAVGCSNLRKSIVSVGENINTDDVVDAISIQERQTPSSLEAFQAVYFQSRTVVWQERAFHTPDQLPFLSSKLRPTSLQFLPSRPPRSFIAPKAMDFTLRCNSLKCRTQLAERAVVTTCRLASQALWIFSHADRESSHVFCNPCSDSLGLIAPPGGNRICPACQTVLPQPDDAVSTLFQPTEDYKTSVLSGLSPTTIMECAGRGLAFWSYQSTQEMCASQHPIL